MLGLSLLGLSVLGLSVLSLTRHGNLIDRIAQQRHQPVDLECRIAIQVVPVGVTSARVDENPLLDEEVLLDRHERVEAGLQRNKGSQRSMDRPDTRHVRLLEGMP